MNIAYTPIGIIRSPFKQLNGMPIQPTSETSAAGQLEIYPEFAEGLKDLGGFSHVYLLYHLHKVRRSKLTVIPFLDNAPHGIFATRAPAHPNPIGLSLVKIVRVEGNFVHVEGIDILNGTPLLDIKPYIPEFEETHKVRTGWMRKSKTEIETKQSDERFLKN